MSRFRKFLHDYVPSFDIDPKREDEIIEKWAKRVSQFGMELPVELFAGGFQYTSTIFSQMLIAPIAPILELLGINGYEYIAFFSKKENVKRLLKRIDELRTAKEGKD